MAEGEPINDGTNINKKIKITTCELCGTKVRTGRMFLRHMKKFHPEELKKETCPKCFAKFSSIHLLINHVITHWSSDEKCPLEVECTCTSIFTRKAKLKDHLLKKHFNADTSLKEEKVHQDKIKKAKLLKCDICDKHFSKPWFLARHARIHNGEKPFTCKHCGSSFNQKYTLLIHERIHTDNRPFKCLKCPAAFVQKGNLKRHVMFLHPAKITSDRINCRYCACSFRNTNMFRLHRLKQHETLTEDQILNSTIIDVMEGLAALNRITQCDENVENSSDDVVNKLKKENRLKKVPQQIKPKFRINYHQCDICKKSFLTSKRLLNHQKEEHNFHNLGNSKEKEKKIEVKIVPDNIVDINNSKEKEKHLQINVVYDNIVDINTSKEEEKHSEITVVSDNTMDITNLVTNISSASLQEADFSFNLFSDVSLSENTKQCTSLSDNILDSIEFNLPDTYDIQNHSTLGNSNMLGIPNDIAYTHHTLENLSFDKNECNSVIDDMNISLNNIQKCMDTSNTFDLCEQLPFENFNPDSNNLFVNPENENYVPQEFENVTSNENQNSILNIPTLPISNNENYVLEMIQNPVNNENNVIINIPTLSVNDNDNYVLEMIENPVNNEVVNIPTLAISDNENCVLKNDECDLNIPILSVNNSMISLDEFINLDINNFDKKNNEVQNPAIENNEENTVNCEKNDENKEQPNISSKVGRPAKKDSKSGETQCDICFITLKRARDLKRHKLKHQDISQFKCNICGKTLSSKFKLKSHENTHLNSPVKKAFCKVCGKKFADNSSLSLHKRIHEGVKPYSCTICPASFRTLGQQKIHIKLHSKPGAKLATSKFQRLLESWDVENIT